MESLNVRPPLVEWTRPIYCSWWARMQDKHGALAAVRIPYGRDWWTLDDRARDAADRAQGKSARVLWTRLGGYAVTTRAALPAIAVALDEAGALSRLTVR